MAFKATGVDGPAEVCRPIGVARTVDPLVAIGPIADWEFE
jgi:hypothetical protein